jgi:hypothetical protein
VYDGLDFLKDQIDFMKTPNFRQRPTAQVAFQHWVETKVRLDASMARWRLRKRDEFVGLRVMRDAVSVVQQSFDNVTRMLNPQASLSLSIGFALCNNLQCLQQRVSRVRTWSNP